MKNTLLAILCTVAIASASPTLFATTPSAGGQDKVVKTTVSKPLKAPSSFKVAKQKFKHMSKSERKAQIAKAKDAWGKLTPQERVAFKKSMHVKIAKHERERRHVSEKRIIRLYAIHMLEQ